MEQSQEDRAKINEIKEAGVNEVIDRPLKKEIVSSKIDKSLMFYDE